MSDSACMRLTLEEPQKVRLAPRELKKELHGSVICYPGTDLETFGIRVKQLAQIGVEELILEGDSKVGKFGIIGKGCVSIVVKAKMGNKIAALKIRRADANRPSMKRDYELQKLANSFGVGPNAIAASDDLFAMEYVNAVKIGRWFESLRSRAPKQPARALVKDILWQCFMLDSHGLDHGEISNPSKHILIRKDSRKSVIIDFESASTTRRPSNLTSVAAFLFLSSPQSEKMRRIVARSNKALPRDTLITLLGDYKREPTQTRLEKIFSALCV